MNTLGQGPFSGGGFISAQGQQTDMMMMPFGFGGFMMQQVPVVNGPVAYYPANANKKNNGYGRGYGYGGAATGHPFGDGRGGMTGGPF